LSGPAGRRALREQSKTSAGQFNINIQGLGGIHLAIPPLKLQEEFAQRISRVEHLKDTHLTHLAELDTLFASLQHRAFRGELWADSPAA
jgi:type I restriction enzyme S subunit